ncbi:MAG TPA: hypothetical protein VFA59_25345 [Vicinamibacterales bacterium]|nr:hypothetical protein [Vicinamibacterales bacterium]
MTAKKEFALVLLGGAILTVILTFPLAVQLGRIGRVDTGDGQFSIWNVAWVARTLVADPLHVFDANIFYPHRDTLAYSESNLGAGIVAIPAYWATRNPYAAHNAAVLFAFFASFVGMYYLARHLTGDRRAAVVAGIAYAFCPHAYTKTAHVQLLMIGGLPVVMLTFHRLMDGPSPRHGTALGLAMAVQALFCGYYGIFAFLMVGFGVLILGTTRRQWANPQLWIALAIGAGVAIAIIGPAFVPYVRVQREGFGRTLEAAASFSANWSAYLASSSHAHVWMLALIPRPSEAVFPGFVAIVFGVLGAAVVTRRRSELALLYGGLALLAFWASFGPQAGLYSLLYRIVPVFSWMRAPARFGLIVTFALCVFSAFGVAALLARVKAATLAGTALAIVTAAELATTWPMVQVQPLEQVYRVLRKLPPGPVIEMPFWYLESMFPRHTYYMLQSTSHWMPLVNGYSDFTPPDYLTNVETLAAFPSRPAFKVLEAGKVRYAIFHRYWYSDETWATVTPRMKELSRYLKPIFVDEGTQLYEIVGFPP